jgi:hypothetical protein
LWKARSLSKKHLADQFGEPGARLYQLLHAAGEDRVAPFSPPPLVEDEYLFDWPTSDAGAIYSAAEYVTERLIARLERRQAQRIEIEIDVRHAGAPLIQGRTLPEATAGHQTVMRIVRKQLEALLEPDHEVVSFTMRLGALRHPDHQQGTLFQTKPGVKKALDAVRRRHPGALLRARVNPHAVFEEDECVLEAFDESQ